MNPGFTLNNLSTRQLVRELQRRSGVQVKSVRRGRTVETTVYITEKEDK